MTLALFASPAEATRYYFNVKGAGHIEDHLPAHERMVSVTVDHRGRTNGFERGWEYVDLPGGWRFTLTPRPAFGWRFVEWQGHEWHGDCHWWGCDYIFKLRCVGADGNAVLTSPADQNKACDFAVDAFNWSALKAVFEDIRPPRVELVAGSTPDGHRVNTNTSVNWHFREPQDQFAEGAGFQCSIDGSQWTGRNSGTAYGNSQRTHGEHSFSVRAIDANNLVTEPQWSSPASVDTVI